MNDQPNLAYYGLLCKLCCAPRVGNTLEIVNAHLNLACPQDMLFPWSPDLGYISAQLCWYLRGKRELDGIDHYSPAWGRIKKKPNGTLDLNSNYGVYVWGGVYDGRCVQSQYDVVIQRLCSDPNTRQAVILFNQPAISVSGTTDHVCTTSLQFLIRDCKLHLIVTMRSNDFWRCLGNDVAFFMMLQEMVWIDVKSATQENLHLGQYCHNVGSLHLQLEDVAAAEEALTQHPKQRVPPPLSDYSEARHIKEVLPYTEIRIRKDPAKTEFFHPLYHRFNWHVKNLLNHESNLKSRT
jgi:thymidylate synthase